MTIAANAAPAAPRWLGALGWGLMAFLSLGIAAYGISYLAGTQAPPVVEDNGMGMRVLMIHASASGIALLLGPLQFLELIRRRARVLHHWIGRTYILACLVGGISGGLLAPFTAAGPIAASGFLMLALLWLWVNAFGWRAAAVKRDYDEHKNWMVRSFALTFAAVTLRLYLIPPQIAGIDFVTAYQWIAWLAWVPNIAIAEWWIASRRTRLVQ
ncbi:DUF2306 domain-containing protein [Terricaulis silvestris]|uniref:Membrane protein (DUF2306) n=1 Tax=Terricaulis silvestris TaxID=2686094 RepID=A0A6I6MU20_9CAUL|nr:DUF2306 domain-containing protein [Terricaulis silvestris]QGZ94663.1 hypothetical protein DSM104635_01490 [Terricaulis silvestris]